MSADQQNVIVYIGDDLVLNIGITDEAGNPLLISGCTFAWLVAQYAGQPGLINKTTSAGITITNATNGDVQITVTHTDTSTLEAGDYWHQLVMTDANEDVTTVTTGTFTVKQRT